MRSRRFTAYLLCLLASVSFGCATTGPAPPAAQAPAHDGAAREIAAAIAQQQIGAPYAYGGETPELGFDCSGLVYYSYTRAGLRVPRTSRELFRITRKIALTDAVPGDVVFFQDQEKLSHVGIYLGERRFVHAPAAGRTVSVARIDSPYYQQHLVAVGRLANL